MHSRSERENCSIRVRVDRPTDTGRIDVMLDFRPSKVKIKNITSSIFHFRFFGVEVGPYYKKWKELKIYALPNKIDEYNYSEWYLFYRPISQQKSWEIEIDDIPLPVFALESACDLIDLTYDEIGL